MAFINSKITYSNNTMTVLKSTQDEYTSVAGFQAMVPEAFGNTIQSVALTAEGFEIVCDDTINDADATLLYHAIQQFCDW